MRVETVLAGERLPRLHDEDVREFVAKLRSRGPDFNHLLLILPILLLNHYGLDIYASTAKLCSETFLNDYYPEDLDRRYSLRRVLDEDRHFSMYEKPYPLTSFFLLRNLFNWFSLNRPQLAWRIWNYDKISHPTPMFEENFFTRTSQFVWRNNHFLTLDHFKFMISSRMNDLRGLLWATSGNDGVMMDPDRPNLRILREEAIIMSYEPEVNFDTIVLNSSNRDLILPDTFRYILYSFDKKHTFLEDLFRFRDMLLPHRDDLPYRQLQTQLSFAFDHFCFLFSSGYVKLWMTNEMHEEDGLVIPSDSQGTRVDIFSFLALVPQLMDIFELANAANSNYLFDWRIDESKWEMWIVKAYAIVFDEIDKFCDRYRKVCPRVVKLPLTIFPDGCSPLHYLIDGLYLTAINFYLDRAHVLPGKLLNVMYSAIPYKAALTPLGHARKLMTVDLEAYNQVHLLPEVALKQLLFDKKLLGIILWRLYHEGAEDNLLARARYNSHLKNHGENVFHEADPSTKFHGFGPDIVLDGKGYFLHRFYGRLGLDDQMKYGERVAEESFNDLYEEYYCETYVEGHAGVLEDVYLQGVPMAFRGTRVP